MACQVNYAPIESDCYHDPKTNSIIDQLFEHLIIRKEMVLTTLIEQIEKRKATKDDFKNIELHSFSSIPYEAAKFSVEIVKYRKVKLGYLTVLRDLSVSFDPGFGFEKSNQ